MYKANTELQSYENDAIDSYFECITSCDLGEDKNECITQCLEVHLKPNFD